MTTYIRVPPESRPLCPNSVSGPINTAHEARVRILNAIYDASPRDDDGEMPEQLESVYGAAESKFSERMDLYRHTATAPLHGRQVVVESWYWRCGVCGLVLPAQRWITD